MGCPATPIPVFHASASAGALSEDPRGRWGSGDQCGAGFGARPSSSGWVPVHPADRPAVTAPGAGPGSTQTVLAVPAAEVLLSTRDGHLHAGCPREGAPRGREGGNRGARGRTGGCSGRSPEESGEAAEAAEGVSRQDRARGGGRLEVAGFAVEGGKRRGTTSGGIRPQGHWRGKRRGSE